MTLPWSLTPAQQAAVTHGEGPLLVLAGAGSGKTRVITCRVAHLIDRGVAPGQILAITFTNKASHEMATRIEQATGGARVWVSTFHAFCARTLRRFAGRVGYGAGFTILDDADQRVAIREALLETGTDPKVYAPPRVLHAIERAKDRLETPQDVEANVASSFDAAVARAYAYYQDLLRENNAMDFSDLLVQTVALLRQDDVRSLFHDRYRHLLIDEYQDTNHAQYQLARLLAGPERSVCATGDPDQSIYGWRGADIGNILRFEQDYPDARVVTLAENFRSTRLILDAANGLIRNNAERPDKDLVTSGEEGAPVGYRVLPDEHEEARWVARCVRERLQDGVPADEVAVFYRAGALSRALETALLERRIPFRVVGSVAFYQRREVKDLLAYLRLVHNPRDDLAVQRVANVPARGIGKTTLAKLKQHARAQGTGLLEAAEDLVLSKAVKGRAALGLNKLTTLVATLRRRAENEPAVADVLQAILDETGYPEHLKHISATPTEEEDRLLNVQSLIAGARDFDRRFGVRPQPAEVAVDPDALPLFAAGAAADPTVPGADDELASGVEGFLQHVALLSAADDQQDGPEGKVSLMTVHAAKGLEFDTVHVVGLEDGLFPHGRSMEDPGGLEEERRLAYVAITRAKRRLVLSRAAWRNHQGRSRDTTPSLFLYELPAEVFEAGAAPGEFEQRYATGGARRRDDPWGEGWGEADGAWDGVDEPPAGVPARGHPRAQPAWRRAIQRSTGAGPAQAAPKAHQPAAGLDAVDFVAGDRVRHELFGYGVVLSARGRAEGRRVEVRFDQDRFGTKNLVLQYARLTKLER